MNRRHALKLRASEYVGYLFWAMILVPYLNGTFLSSVVFMQLAGFAGWWGGMVVFTIKRKRWGQNFLESITWPWQVRKIRQAAARKS